MHINTSLTQLGGEVEAPALFKISKTLVKTGYFCTLTQQTIACHGNVLYHTLMLDCTLHLELPAPIVKISARLIKIRPQVIVKS